MAKHYVYRMDHDTGFAPHVSEDVCTLCGCKTTTVEAWAKPADPEDADVVQIDLRDDDG